MENRFWFPKQHAGKIHVTTNGCSENRMDGAKMESFFRMNRWPVTAHIKDADIILFNACGLTLEREDHSLAVLTDIHARKKPSAEVILCGCLPAINPKRARNAHSGKIITGEMETRLETLFEADTPCHGITANYLLPEWRFPLTGRRMAHMIGKEKIWPDKVQKALHEILTGRSARKNVAISGPNTHSIKISTGCLDNCAFCGVRIRRGRVKSKPESDIMDEFLQGLKSGFRTFACIGTDIGAYGRDRSTNLSTLLEKIIGHSQDIRMNLPNINPRWLKPMLPEIKKIVQTGKIGVIGTSLQSGSDRILNLMNRKYTVADYVEIVATLKKAWPGLHIMSTVIVGYPGETDADFQQTVEVLHRLPLTWAYIHRYSPRPEALGQMPEHPTPEDVIDKRYRFLNQMFYDKLLKHKCKAIINIPHKLGEKRYGSCT